ncbi:acyltransferase [Sphingomonas sp. BIUV-7]|uniref:Acyltransferase n=1 Tax=Sphingomonas natans TaxID=3063330 RepID=A0ABT8YC88_9SPHN|nr:acyltransferase [Sphingomonas sp. BIUV-7]MDO6415939.1 acyltransferase [Sphingomonas sp. BIUV-7]
MDDPRASIPLLRSLEGLRLISSLGIVSIHMLPHVGLIPPDGFDLFVDLFFVISGIVIGQLYVGAIENWSTYGTFLRRRLARIYPLHLATLLFYIAIGFGVARYHLTVDDPSRFDTGQILPNLLLVQAWFPNGRLSYNFVSWSISAELFAYLCFPLIAALATRRAAWGLAALLLMLALSIAIAEGLLGRPLTALRWDCSLPRVIPSFAFGIFMSRFGGDILRWAGGATVRAAFTVFAIGTVAGMALGVSSYTLLALIWGLGASAYLCDLDGWRTIAAWRPISDRGYLTYSLYMLHVPVSTVFLSFVFPRLLGASPAALAASIVLATIILFAAAELSFRLFEQPLRKRLR